MNLGWHEIDSHVHASTGLRGRFLLNSVTVEYLAESNVASQIVLNLTASGSHEVRRLIFGKPRGVAIELEEVGGQPIVVVDLSHLGWDSGKFLVVGDYEEAPQYFFADSVHVDMPH